MRVLELWDHGWELDLGRDLEEFANVSLFRALVKLIHNSAVHILYQGWDFKEFNNGFMFILIYLSLGAFFLENVMFFDFFFFFI